MKQSSQQSASTDEQASRGEVREFLRALRWIPLQLLFGPGLKPIGYRHSGIGAVFLWNAICALSVSILEWVIVLDMAVRGDFGEGIAWRSVVGLGLIGLAVFLLLCMVRFEDDGPRSVTEALVVLVPLAIAGTGVSAMVFRSNIVLGGMLALGVLPTFWAIVTLGRFRQEFDERIWGWIAWEARRDEPGSGTEKAYPPAELLDLDLDW